MDEVAMLRGKLDNVECAMLGGGASHRSTQSPHVWYIRDYIPDVSWTVPKFSYYSGKVDSYKHVSYF